MAAQPSATPAGGRVAQRREGGGRGPALETTALPPPPPRRAGDGGTGNPLRLSPPCRRAAATGGGGRRGAEPQRRWRGRREGRAEPPARPHLGFGPVPSLLRRTCPTGGTHAPRSPAALPCVLAGAGWLGSTCSGQGGWGAPGPARDGLGGRAWQRSGCTAKSEQHRPLHTLASVCNHQTPRARGKACALF